MALACQDIVKFAREQKQILSDHLDCKNLDFPLNKKQVFSDKLKTLPGDIND